MAISVTCAECDYAFKVKDEHAGKKIRCPQCKEAVVVPGAKSTAVAAGAPRGKAAAPPLKKKARIEEENEDQAEEEEEQEEKPKKKKKKKKKSNKGLLVGVIAGVGVLAIAVSVFVIMNKPGNAKPSTPNPNTDSQAKADDKKEQEPEKKEEKKDDAPKPKPEPPRKKDGGLISGVARRMEAPEVQNCLKNIGLAYNTYFTTNGRAPSKLEDLELRNAKLEDPVKKELIVVIWNANLRNLPAGGSNTVLAWEYYPDVFGHRFCLMVDNSIQKLDEQEFKKAAKASPK